MISTKLILVEGIPGSGKTTTAINIKKMLDHNQIPNQLYLEGDLDHPVDYETVACLHEVEYKQIINKFYEHLLIIEQFTTEIKKYKLVQYGKLREQVGIDNTIIETLSKYDVYNVSLDTYIELITDRWLEFVNKVTVQNQEVTILECCFIQNPVTLLFGRFNQSKQFIAEHINKISEIIEPLNPQIIYFYQDDVRQTLNRVIQERSDQWLQHLIWYFTDQGYGKSNGYHGLDGAIKVMEKRKSYELEIINQLQIEKLIINNTAFNWDDIFKKINRFLKVTQ